MDIKAKIIFKYTKKSYANLALKSLRPDNTDFIRSYVEDKSLVCKLKADSLRTALATVDDILFCEMMVERMIDLTEGDKS